MIHSRVYLLPSIRTSWRVWPQRRPSGMARGIFVTVTSFAWADVGALKRRDSSKAQATRTQVIVVWNFMSRSPPSSGDAGIDSRARETSATRIQSPRCIDQLTISVIAASSTGLRRNANAFILLAFRRVSGLSSSATTMIARSMPRAASSALSSSADCRDMLASTTTHPDVPESRAARKSTEDEKPRTA